MECLLPYFNVVTVPHNMVGLERMSDYRGVGLERFNCTTPHDTNHYTLCSGIDSIIHHIHVTPYTQHKNTRTIYVRTPYPPYIQKC